MARRLVAMPGVVGPVAPSERFQGAHPAHVLIQHGQGVVHPVHPVLADHAEQSHAAAGLDAPGARTVCLLDHLRLISLGEETLFALLATVALGHRYQRPRDAGEGIVPCDLDELVVAAAVELVVPTQFLRELWEPGVGPGLPAPAHNRMPEPVRAIQDAVEGVALGTLSRIPVRRGFVAVEIRVGLVVVGGPQTGHDPVSDVGPGATRMGVVGGTDPVEGRIVLVLIAVDLLPIAGHRSGQWILARLRSGQEP